MTSQICHTMFTALLLISFTAVNAQETPDTVGSIPGIEIKTSVDRAEIYIGDLITYNIAITYDSTYKLEPPPLGANLGAFDVKDYQPDIESRLDDGRIRSRTTFVLSTFTTGDYVIPPVPIIFTLPDSSRKILLAEPVPINVLSLLENAGDSADIRPLKAQYEFPEDYSTYYFWGGIGLVALVIAAILWLLFRRKKAVDEQIDLRPSWEIAFEHLAFLKESALLTEEKYKEYYLRLTEIARVYLGRMYNADIPEMTTEQLLEHFIEINLPDNLYDELSAFFKHADLVKFARYVPERERAEADFGFAHDMIERIRVDKEKLEQMMVQSSNSKQTAAETSREDSVR